MKECGVYVEGHGTIASFPCSLEQGHDGPHATDDVPASKRKRAQWSQEQPQSLDAFQPEFQTTAQRLTENPTEHPDVVKQREQESQELEQTPAQQVLTGSGLGPNVTSISVGAAESDNGSRLAVLRVETATGFQVYMFTPESFAKLHELIGRQLSSISSRIVVARDLP
jgi:hypothetical protein